MNAIHWLQRLLGQPDFAFTRKIATRRGRFRPWIEPLEWRRLPSLTTLASFLPPVCGATPYSGVIEDTGGNLFGTASNGGPFNDGTVYELHKGSSLITPLAYFEGTNGSNPFSKLIEDGSGNLFGTTAYGGASDQGTIFELPKDSSAVISLASFNGTNGANPMAGLVQDGQGSFFGTTANGGAFGFGTVFELTAGSSAITVLASFDNNSSGDQPNCDLVLDSNGDLFGTTTYGGAANLGTVFELPHGSGVIATLASFSGANGSYPFAGLVEDSNGNLFGTTYEGGRSGYGTVFEVQPASGIIADLASFFGSPDGEYPACDLVIDRRGSLFGTTTAGGTGNGTLFEVGPGSGYAYPVVEFGFENNPYAGLLEDASGNLFGTTSGSTISFTAPSGSVFELPWGTATITTLASFNGADGMEPRADLVVDSSGNLFGITSAGGLFNSGAVYEVPVGSSAVTTLASLNDTNTNGASGTLGGLVEDSAGNLYGTTALGGTSGDGTVFEIPKGSSSLTILASFPMNYGSPFGKLLIDSSGNLYGTTGAGGPSFYGTIFELPSGSSSFMTLASFDFADGVYPNGGLIEDASGDLFGTAYEGGSTVTSQEPAGAGTVFELSHGSSTITKLGDFDVSNGALPRGGLAMDSEGNLFGTTWQEGPFGDGTVFEVPHGSSSIITLVNFDFNNGAHPDAGLIADSKGDLFGTTAGGGPFDDGTVFEVAHGTWTITTLATFNGVNGAYPQAALTEDSSGDLFGTTAYGGNFNQGTVFEISTVAIAIATTQVNDALAGLPYNQTILASGGTGSLTFSTASGTLPTGLTLSNSGVLSGITTTPGTYSFSVTATDMVGSSASRNYEMTVDPGEYMVRVLGPGAVQAGQGILISVQATDGFGNPITNLPSPTSVTVGVSPAPVGSTSPTSVAIATNGLGLILASLQQIGTYTIIVSIGGVVLGTAVETVIPGPPAKLAFGVHPLDTPTGITVPPVRVQVLDMYGNLVSSDNSDSVTLAVATGPGNFLAGSTLIAPVTNGVATFNNLVLTVPGSYTLNEVVPALYTGPNSAPFSVIPLQVSSFIATSSGFALTFNVPILVNENTPALYGTGYGAMGLTPSVTLTGPNGTVPGSVVLNTATNSLTFVATNTSSFQGANGTPILPAGTYTVDLLSSGLTGFQALSSGGGYLDGPDNGTAGSGDFTTTFAVSGAAAGQEVVWVPDVAAGPGQSLEAPGRGVSGGGYPVYLFGNSTAVTSVTGTLTYNPTYLTVTSGSGGPGFTVNLAKPGTATFIYNGPAVAAGNTPLGYLNWAGALTPLSPGYSLAGGGTLAPGTTYYYEITSTNGAVESPGSVPMSITIPAGTNPSVILNWPQDLLATGYKLYRTTTTAGGVPVFGPDSLLTSISGGGTTTFTDTGTPTTAGTPPTTAGFNTATVPNGTAANPLAIYKAKDLLQVSAKFNGTIPAQRDSALHLVAFTGDADGNGVYSSGDAVAITRVALSADTGFTAFPLVDPTIVADTDGNGYISTDAAFQANELGVGYPAFSVAPVPGGVHVSPGDLNPVGSPPGPTILPIGNGLDPTLTLPANLQAGPDGTVVVPVNIDDPHPAGSTGLIEAHLALSYNPSLFTVSAGDVHAGSVLAGGDWSLVPTIDQATGLIGIALASNTPISSPEGGSLVTIDFHPIEPSGGHQPPGTSAQFDLVASVTPNGQYVMTELEDSQGTFTLTPAPTNGFDPRIDGVAFLTATPATATVGSSVHWHAGSVPYDSETRPSTASNIVETQGADDRPAEALPTGTSNPTPTAPAGESSAQDESGSNPAAEVAPFHGISLHGIAAAIAGSAATFAAAPLTGLTFQVTGTLALGAPAGAGMAAGQSGADQIFQALARATNNLSDPPLGATAKEALTRQLLLLPLAADGLEDLTWHKVASDLAGLGFEQTTGLLARAGRRTRTANPMALVSAQQAAADQPAVDRYFAQMADDVQQAVEEDGREPSK